MCNDVDGVDDDGVDADGVDADGVDDDGVDADIFVVVDDDKNGKISLVLFFLRISACFVSLC